MSGCHDEDGISLVEIAVSLAILGLVLTTFFLVITNGLRSLSDSRARQSSSQISTELIETLRAVSPPEVAMYVDPLVDEADEFDPSAFTCGGVQGQFDPDGAGPLGCEEIRTSSQGVITGTAPFQDLVDGTINVTTIATRAVGAGIPADTVRVTVLLEYDLPSGAREVRRSAFFSEVNRG